MPSSSAPSASSTSATDDPSTSSSMKTTPAASKTEPKPIKLRAACNHCFSAKVRCDGNKEGCRRCCEKRLSCVYSESRVGKVVGKRRKRPIDDSIGTINSQSWIVHNSLPIQSIPSPATTHTSDEANRRHGKPPAWPSFVVNSDPGFLAFDETADSLGALEMTDNRSYSMASDLSFFNNSGLPTPGLSPPQVTRYLSPAQLEARPFTRHSSCPVDPSKLQPPTYAVPLSRNTEPGLEDEETVCIKLLAHLKKYSSDESQPREMQIELLKKSNAAVRRILRSKSVRSDYSCHLLLSNIINHLVRLCERLCQGRLEEYGLGNMECQFLQDQVHFEGIPAFFDAPVPSAVPAPDQDLLESLVREVNVFISIVADFLKKRPIYGFQHLGRHETFHVELEQRLKKATVLLQS
ncbi:uncharacterized protein Z520_01619 [Fonsecaea multimorphosa CBS 102226]|uniref:Zn(2)-C6 fungal-type domain-containing protein n=1 Tax=Fonsecaea multimorphosa CBS 102226 TaxID=1442371 RepID=A0A0D2J192_9EURO|nr:uncharacterized protein Z520_01619 [Fonsecaea multimorphosa CBS 102226]KIY03152.1 hypothetical protein Z520_01619 [Fonsecaea multimorphosa CBS 102226]OAL30397.1 hypothetical protein AYO22_01595 [Fonsecaea multimorphosa]